MKYRYDRATRTMRRMLEGGGPLREIPPQDSLWAKIWVWRARGYVWEKIAAEVAVPVTTVEMWAKQPRFQAGLEAAIKAWDQAAIKREVAHVELGGGRSGEAPARLGGPKEDLTGVLGG